MCDKSEKFDPNIFFCLNLGATKDSHHYLERANRKSEWILEMYMKYWMVGFAINMISMDAFSAMACWLMFGTIDAAHLYRPCLLRQVEPLINQIS